MNMWTHVSRKHLSQDERQKDDNKIRAISDNFEFGACCV